MSWVLALAGWGVALALACSLRRRLSLVADAEHELRGAAAAIGLAAERMWRTGASAPFRSLVGLQLDRISAGLADLAAARSWRGQPACEPRLDAARLARVIANLAANATEHGVGPVDVRTSRPPGGVRIEIRNRNRPQELEGSAARQGRGRGLAIATRAARQLGGELRVEWGDDDTTATLRLPEPPPDESSRAA